MTDNRAGIWAKQRDRRLFAVTETTFGTQVKPIATDAFRMLSGAIESPTDHRIERDDNRPSRSLEAQITGSIPPVAWSYEGYVIPSGTAGTPPDIHPLLMAALGADSYTNTPATSDAYLLTDTAQNRGSVSLYEFYPAGGSAAKDGIMAETLLGAIVSTLSISGGAGEPPKISLAGVGSQYALTGRDDVNDQTTPESSATFTVTNGNQFNVGSLVMFLEEADGTTLVDDASGAGFLVTAIDGNDITVSPSTGATVADNDIVAPWGPTETVAGEPIPGTLGSLTVEGVNADPLAYEFNLDNGDQPHESEAFRTWAMSGYHEAKRRVTGQFTIRCKASELKTMTQRSQYGNVTLALVLGTTAGSILTVGIEAEMGFASQEKSEEDTVICVCPFKGVATSANAKDELALTFT